jgi:hypothetical protein
MTYRMHHLVSDIMSSDGPASPSTSRLLALTAKASRELHHHRGAGFRWSSCPRWDCSPGSCDAPSQRIRSVRLGRTGVLAENEPAKRSSWL